ncbi:MAG: RecX family transcriptional regulator [Candidatus Saccharibacteria bacterium]
MPVITDIRKQKKSDQRFSIFIDDTYSFGLGDLELSASSLRIGTNLSEAEVSEWKEKTEANRAYFQGLFFLSFRLRSVFEIREYLKKKDWDSEVIELTIERLSQEGQLDDLVFARAWIQTRQLQRSRSKSHLRSELMLKRIDRDLIDEALSELDEEGEDAALDRLIEKMRRQSRYSDDKKLAEYLGRQGFKYGDIKKALARSFDTEA